MHGLNGKVAIVTGASKGIGAAIARQLAAEGASVVVNYASSQRDADTVVSTIQEGGGRAVAVKGDVSKAEDARAIIDAAIQTFGRLDILVNNAGRYEFASLKDITEEHFHTLMNINVLGLLLVTQAAAIRMGAGGSIINIGASITTMKPPTSSVYAASKSAVETITGVLSKELGAKGIRINCVNPGPTETEGSAGIRGGGSGNGLVAQTPLGRIGQPEDIARIAAFLASEESGWMTGAVLIASGGLQ
ncbi:glucose 1-dehydrogenase [Sphingomonas oligophenolica]|uniref:Glucose 1-dehydrogenase n=1 Tax=Sphingomonas oligophenolica TaxID=301154 RepID=A0ABU9Y6B9_9SPHN